MNIRSLRCFAVAAHEENLHRAAETLHLTPSALSRRIQDLEEELGVRLFDRTKQRVCLSKAGRTYLKEIEPLLQKLDLAATHARQIDCLVSGTLSLAYNETVIRHSHVLNALQIFRIRHNQVTLRLEHMIAEARELAVEKGTVDAAFLYGRPPDHPRLDGVELCRDPLMLALPRSHRLADRDDISLEDLKGEPFLWVQRDAAPALHDRLLGACRSGGLEPNIVQHLMGEDSRLNLVAAGMGLAFVTGAFRDFTNERVVIRPVANFDCTLTLELVWRSNDRSPALDLFIDILAQTQVVIP